MGAERINAHKSLRDKIVAKVKLQTSLRALATLGTQHLRYKIAQKWIDRPHCIML